MICLGSIGVPPRPGTAILFNFLVIVFPLPELAQGAFKNQILFLRPADDDVIRYKFRMIDQHLNSRVGKWNFIKPQNRDVISDRPWNIKRRILNYVSIWLSRMRLSTILSPKRFEIFLQVQRIKEFNVFPY